MKSKKLEKFNKYTDYVGLKAGRTKDTTITTISINTLFTCPAGIVRAFINIFARITYKFNIN